MKFDSGLWAAGMITLTLGYGVFHSLASRDELSGTVGNAGAAVLFRVPGPPPILHAGSAAPSPEVRTRDTDSDRSLRPASRDPSVSRVVAPASGRMVAWDDGEHHVRLAAAVEQRNIPALRELVDSASLPPVNRADLHLEALVLLGSKGNSDDQVTVARLTLGLLTQEVQKVQEGRGEAGRMLKAFEVLASLPKETLRGSSESVVAAILNEDGVPRAVRSAAAQCLSRIGGVRAHAHLAAYRDSLKVRLAEGVRSDGSRGDVQSQRDAELVTSALRDVEASLAALR